MDINLKTSKFCFLIHLLVLKSQIFTAYKEITEEFSQLEMTKLSVKCLKRLLSYSIILYIKLFQFEADIAKYFSKIVIFEWKNKHMGDNKCGGLKV